MWYGEVYLEYCPGGNYSCPHYCTIDHIHITGDCDENKKKQEAYKQRYSANDPRTAVQTRNDTLAAR